MNSFKLKSEVKKYLSSGFIAAFGLITALAWKDVFNEYLIGIVSLSPIQGKLISAAIITVISLIAIIFITRVLGSKK